MDLLLVRHGESQANAEGRMQGRLDSALSEHGRAQARQLGAWLVTRGIGWDAAYCSPLRRAAETAALLAEVVGSPPAQLDPELAEIDAGALEGMNRDDMAQHHPEFLARSITELGDFGALGGESYDQIQARVSRVLARLVERHRDGEQRVLLVAHGGVNFQLLKLLVCLPVPRVCIVRMGNCSVTRIRMRERRGTYIGELVWHVPIELMGQVESADTGAVFR